MFCASWAINCWLVFMLCLTSESLVTLANQSSNTTKSPSATMTEGTPSNADVFSVEPTTMDGTTYAGHKLQCTAEERRRVSCLHGECFAVDLNHRVVGCECQPGWDGPRCQFMEIPPDIWEASSLVGLIVGLVAGVVAVVVGALIVFFWRRKQNRQHSPAMNGLNAVNGECQSHRNSGTQEGVTEPLNKIETKYCKDEQPSNS